MNEESSHEGSKDDLWCVIESAHLTDVAKKILVDGEWLNILWLVHFKI